jgi:hypothetical protein
VSKEKDSAYTDETWYHSSIDKDKFANDLYYQHCDFRKEKVHLKLSNEKYNSFEKSWYFKTLPYADISTQINWDPFHKIANDGKWFIKLCKGSTDNFNGKIREHCKNTSCHLDWLKLPEFCHLPWVLTNEKQDTVDAYLCAILVPKSISNEFEVQTIFKKGSFTKGIGHIQLMSVVMKYILSAMDLEEAYTEYFKMYADDLVSLLRNAIENEEDINNLHNKTVETLCVREGIFSPAESSLVAHQIIDLPNYINWNGPLRNWWAFSGERAIAFFKQFIQKGGLSKDITQLNRYLKKEYTIMRTAYDFNKENIHLFNDVINGKPKETNTNIDAIDHRYNQIENNTTYQITFNPLKHYLYNEKTIKKSKMSTIEINSFLNALENEALCNADTITLLKKSAFFRLLCSYKATKDNKSVTKVLTFYQFLKMILMEENSINLYMKETQNIIYIVKENILSNFDLKQQFQNEQEKIEFQNLFLVKGIVLKKDFEACNALLDFFNVDRNKIYKSCEIKGCSFQSRGFDYKEFIGPVAKQINYGHQITKSDKNSVANELNVLKHNWRKEKQYSSWCKFKFKNFLDETTKTYFGQINYFFELKIPHDKVLNKLAFASVTARNISIDLKYGLQVLNCIDEISYASNIRFIPIKIIIPTSILVAGFDNENKPYKNKKSINKEINIQYCFSKKEHSDVKQLILIDLNPSEELIKYN